MSQADIPESPEQGGSLPWFALHVRSNHENYVQTALRGQQVEEFLPTYEIRRGKEVFVRPLFPGYLFARLNVRHRLPVMKISGLLAILGDHAGPIAVSDLEVEQLRRLVASPLPVTPHAPVAKGQRVRVMWGPLVGYEGVVVRFKGSCRVVATFTTGAAAVEVDRDSLELLN